MSRDYQKLNKAELNNAVLSLKGWEIEEGKLARSYTFKDYKQSFGFATQIALCAQQLNHHPDMFVTYDEVHLALWTHSADVVTTKDVELAEMINKLRGKS